MKLEPNDLLLFAHVVATGSFTRAAERAGLPKSTVSRRIAALEAQLGERLLLRTTRKLMVTDFGRGVFEHAQQVVDGMEAAAALALHRQAEPAGRLRVSMPADLANLALSGLMARFIDAYPAISLELDLSPRRVDLIGENFDLAIRMGALPDDATLAARQIARFSRSPYAAPAYLARHGRPEEPEALMEHEVLHLLTRSGEREPWEFHRGEQQWSEIPPGRAAANSPELLMALARSGAGIAIGDDHFVKADVSLGTLIPLLPDWSMPSMPAWAVFPGRRLMPARTRVFLDALQEEFSGPKCQQEDILIEEGKRRARGVVTTA